jgi:hypothetical protein
MRIAELLFEAKPDNLGQGMLDKLYKSYQKKDANRETMADGMAVAQELFKYVGSDYLQWTAKQYNQDNYFFIHDLPQWKTTLDEFKKVARDRRIPLERDINRYKNIDDLREKLDKATGTQQELGSKFYSDAIELIDGFVKKGEAVWRYRSPQYSIYIPKTFESSNICSKLLSTTVCTIMNENNFKEYREGGTLFYIISQDKLFNCYISHDLEQNSEFSDEKNNHSYDLKWMLREFPVLKGIAKQAISPHTELDIKLLLLDTDAEKRQASLEAVSYDGSELSNIPSEYRDAEICAVAVSKDNDVCEFVPEKLWYEPEFIDRANSLDPYLKNYILFASESEIMDRYNKIKEKVEDLATDTLGEWEISDDYFRDWQMDEARKRGYLLMPDGTSYTDTPEQNAQLEAKGIEPEELEVDTDRMYEDSDLNDYTDFNDEARRWYKSIRGILDDMDDVKEIKKAAIENLEEERYLYDLSDISKIIANAVRKDNRDNASFARKIEDL